MYYNRRYISDNITCTIYIYLIGKYAYYVSVICAHTSVNNRFVIDGSCRYLLNWELFSFDSMPPGNVTV